MIFTTAFALLVMVAVGLWVTVPWFDDNRLLISIFLLALAIIASAIPVEVYARIAAYFAS